MADSDTEVETLILGGGIAGLSAAIRLTELGKQPLVVEAGDYPSHKVCGEFFSTECLSTLHCWGIQPVASPTAHFHTPTANLTFPFPTAAGGLSHLITDPQLAQRAIAGGAIIKTLTKVTQLDLAKRAVTLESGEVVKCHQLILSTGRLTQAKPIPLYMGVKAHFEGFSNCDSLEMYSFPGAYLGISPIEEGKFNVACLATLKTVEACGSPEKLMEKLMKDFKGRQLFPWMTTSIPAFGCKKIPSFPHCYFVGDAAGTIPPAAGNGLSMAITGGIMAAEYASRSDSEGFRKAWRQRYHSPIFWGSLFHEALSRPWLLNTLFRFSRVFPIAQAFYKQMR